MAEEKKVKLPTNDELLSKETKTYLAICVAVWRTNATRRDVPNHVVDRIYELEHRVQHPDGTPFLVSDDDIDALYGEDGSCKWVDELSAFCGKPPKQRTRRSNLQRYRLLWIVAYFDTHE